MGLDITHWKLSSEKTDSSQMFLKEEIELGVKDINRLSEEVYKNSLVDGFWEFIAVFDNDQDLKLSRTELEELNDGYRHFKLVVSRTDELFEEKINKFEIDNGISNFNKKQDNIEIELKDSRKIQFTSICYEGKLNRKVAYFREAGYQRKGMGNGFSEYFKNDSFYCEQKSFKKLLDFSSPNNHMYEEGNIENNFIQNYTQGKSILMISW
ncbi:hypothetical protein [Aquimarina latercula]|uniref:hypothetical protein n=1 Tax=Aquimarina latercula TaxID=987 RepID=UPI0004820B7F|nr:hypothetical protein [Aquimarina latercula]